MRFDQRGNGLSDREVDEISVDWRVDDMAAVADAAGLERFALFGISQGASMCTRFAVRYPERATRPVVFGG